MVERDMRNWLERAVIGLNLCPFAKAVSVHGQIHYAVSGADAAQDLLEDLRRELLDLAASDAQLRDTTLLVAPDCLDDFLDFNDFLDDADRLLCELDLDGVLQIASFHPRYQFAGSSDDDIGNYTNRAPYPTLHLLREASVDRAVAAFPQADVIVDHNLRTLEQLGQSGWDALDVGRTARPSARGARARKSRGKI